MKNKELAAMVEQLMIKVDDLAAALAVPEQKSATRWGEEPKQEGSVVAFQVQFSEYGRVYHYAAIRFDTGLWSLTGNTPNQFMRWKEFCAWLDKLYEVRNFALMKRVER